MYNTVVSLLSAALVLVSTSFAGELETSAVTPYLGLSIPYPDTIPSFVVEIKKESPLRNRSMMVFMAIEKNGKVSEIEYPPDSAAYIEPIEKKLKKIKFHFPEGRQLKFPVSVPARMVYSSLPEGTKGVNLKFPVSADLITDSELLSVFFEKNGVIAPEVTHINSIFYKVDHYKDKAEYLTVSARVFLDEKGELTNLTFPIRGQDEMTHPVRMAIMNAQFTPASLNGQPFTTDFLLTFRIFDNIKFPFSPLGQADSTAPEPITARYVMMRYLNEADIALPPLPRKHNMGYIQAAKLARYRVGIAEISLRIDERGQITGISIMKASPGLEEVAREVMMLVNWYPAISNKGEAEIYVGKVLLEFNGSTKVVYIPEWLNP